MAVTPVTTTQPQANLCCEHARSRFLLCDSSAAAAGNQQLRLLGVYEGDWNWAVGFHPEFCCCCLTLQRPFLSLCRMQQKQAVEHLIALPSTPPFRVEPCNKCSRVPYGKCSGMRKQLCNGTSHLSNSSMVFPRQQRLQVERQPGNSHGHLLLLPLRRQTLSRHMSCGKPALYCPDLLPPQRGS